MTLRNPFTRKRPTDLFSWFHSHLLPTATDLADTYRNAQPFPHIVIDDFLPDDIAALCLARFPKPEDAHYKQPDVGAHQVRKLGRTQESYFRGVDPGIRRVLSEFNEMPFLDFLEGLTGIAGLIPDPHFRGGAFHQILAGGKLDMHADFNVDGRRRLLRRINVLIYLNRPWPADYGGELCLRRDGASSTSVRVLPIFNRCVIFNTDSTSLHGHPEPLAAPQGVTRKSIALYYYTSDPAAFDPNAAHSTIWVPTNSNDGT
ncbi:MAG: 2OG-Fe(II) oxygenase [Gammaproteobacteria bacterium]|nr:2OG-Fe(II) oxygenase [Gammaproteobacteria bacterium]